MDKETLQYMAGLAAQQGYNIVVLDKEIWTPEKMVELTEALVQIAQSDKQTQVQ